MRTRGWCSAHYQRWLRHGDPLKTLHRIGCDFPDCDRPHAAHGFCHQHYKQQWRGRELGPIKDLTLSPEDRFWLKVDKSGDCWPCSGNLTRDGYSRVWVDGVQIYAHCYAYTLEVGPIPNGMEVDHICFVPNCVRPDHLRLVTHKQNNEHRSGPLSNSQSGVRGVYWDKKNRCWVAQIGHHGKNIHIGRYDTLAEADMAARAKRAELFTHDDAVY